ncbi:DUF2630 family protein [Spiractinospora alimapuensis]|uniref:DUF2630 family protein n=1 Tax=Spiractinospora alimapuensis TaxID=2820884 RepID=UPI0022AB4408|nr:DUF2630 family protein [Spiractinospora alimapuensis]QVQ52618.1 DUF2630 family protein [Spiractinospora alimapuensis]
MSVDNDIFARIKHMTQEERDLRSALASGGSTDEDRARVAELERQLDQCWDLLRQRRARREFGQDPNEAALRSENEVEHYRQ